MSTADVILTSILKTDTALEKASARAVEEKVKSTSLTELVDSAVAILKATNAEITLDEILNLVYTLRQVADGKYTPKTADPPKGAAK